MFKCYEYLVVVKEHDTDKVWNILHDNDIKFRNLRSYFDKTCSFECPIVNNMEEEADIFLQELMEDIGLKMVSFRTFNTIRSYGDFDVTY